MQISAPMTLPIEAILPALLETLAQRSEAVLAAPPGAGKTTRLPLALLAAPFMAGRKMILLSPRRIAARAAAQRMAALLGESVGDTVGYRVRLEQRVSGKTRIEVVTEGVFTRMIQSDPALEGVGAVLLDEFHERSLEADLALALARDAQQGLRPDLRLLVMSATLDTSRIAAALGDAPIVVAEGRAFPLQFRYVARAPNARLEADVARVVRQALREEAGSALVFLPGAGEIERTAALLRESGLPDQVDLRPLYGALSPDAQDAALAPAPPGRRKVVLATSIAETSLTIEGVRIVIDCGLSRRARHEPDLGLTHLETVRASQAAITQRAGRAGRLEPGIVYRLWDEGETRAFPAYDRPEILDADLSGLALDLAAWGVVDPMQLVWLDAPPAPAWREARMLLLRIGALDEAMRLNPHGRALAAYPLAPRLAHMVHGAASSGDARLAAEIAVLLSEQGLAGRDIDIGARVRRFAHERGARAEAARALARRIAGLAGGADQPADPSRAGAVLTRAFPDRIAKARGGEGARARVEFLMANGRAASLPAEDSLARAPYLVVADATGRADRAAILAAAPIELREIEDACGADILTDVSVTFDEASGSVRARRRRKLGRIVLSDAPSTDASATEIEAALIEAVRRGGLSLLPWSPRARQLRARVSFMRGLEGERWPDWSDSALIASLEHWLPVSGARALNALEPRLADALLATLPYALQRALDEAAPQRFVSPAGAAHDIDYEAEGGPAVDVRVQEMFGLARHPMVAGRPLVLRLTSPAGRPVQTTRDLPGFWRGSYAGVRADLRGRYPKHPWPEDPLNAPPTLRAKPRS